ncbi:glyoxylate/hydroxypyruvate reductase A [Castellaniella sp. GW247-6E4]|uniref:2-hydroxyacid dehydrogenase n=1 Tax=Castellaniella sp. GW247-6E4 TaxID=3140380 RepID=UPI003314A2F0
MEVVFASQSETQPEDWVCAFQEALPGMRVRAWGDGSAAGGAEIALVWNPPADLFEREPRLRIVFTLGAGVDALLRMPGRPAHVPIVRLEDGGMAVQMAEYVLHFLLRAARGFGRYAQFQAQGRWQRLDDIVREDWPVGIMGAGVLGARVARTIAALEYPVAAWSRSGRAPEGIEGYGGDEGLSAFLGRTRVLVNILPLTAQTEGILCRRVFERMRPHGYLINIARGRHLVEDDLLAALDGGLLEGAALDVFAQEPLPPGHPFWAHPRLQITPHIAGASLVGQTVRQISAKIQAFQRGEPVSGMIDPELQY